MVQMIRAVQPVGPYRVAGWSAGGILAYEIAIQLLGEDQQVEFVGLLDTSIFAPNSLPESRTNEFDDKALLMKCVENLVDQHTSLRADKELSKAIGRMKLNLSSIHFAELVHWSKERSLLPIRIARLPAAQLRRFLAWLHLHGSARAQYFPQTIRIPVYLFAAQDNDTHKPLLGWNEVLPEVQVCEIPVPGTHISMMDRRNVAPLGQALSHTIGISAENARKTSYISYSPQVPMQLGNLDHVPLFCVPGAGASVSSFAELISNLPQEWPICGLEPRGLDGELLPHTTVSAAAKCYVETAHRINPKGPVRLLGHSFGGLVAFEMAKHLNEFGINVASIIIVDSTIADGENGLIHEYTRSEIVMSWIKKLELLVERSFGVTMSEIDSRDETAQLALLHNRLVSFGQLPPSSSATTLRGPLRTYSAALRAHYRPGSIHYGPLLLLLADNPRLNRDANRCEQERLTRAWKRWAPNLVYRHIPGNHMTLLRRPNATAIARSILEQAFGSHESPSDGIGSSL
jgi:thioesterase domain-containing protein